MIDRIRGLGGNAPTSEQAEEISRRLQEVSAEARGRLGELPGKIRDYTRNEPARALGIALGMGVFLGWLIKRR